MARKKSLMGSLLGGSFGKSSKKESGGGMANILGRAGKQRGRKRKDAGMGNDLEAQFSKGVKHKRRRNMEGQLDAADLLKRKMTKSEYLDAKDQADQAAEQDQQIRAKISDENMAGNEGFIRRLMRIIISRSR